MKKYIIRFVKHKMLEVTVRATSEEHARTLFECGNYELSQVKEFYPAWDDNTADLDHIVEDEKWNKGRK